MGSGSFALTTAASEPVALNVGGNGQSTAFTGVMTGLGSLVKQGSGTLTISQSQAYAGATNITGGVLQLVTGGGGGAGAQFWRPLRKQLGKQRLNAHPRRHVGGPPGATMTNWVNLVGGGNGQSVSWVNQPLTDYQGNATTAEITVAGQSGCWGSGATDHVLDGYLYNFNSTPMPAVITGIPYAKYNIYGLLRRFQLRRDDGDKRRRQQLLLYAGSRRTPATPLTCGLPTPIRHWHQTETMSKSTI